MQSMLFVALSLFIYFLVNVQCSALNYFKVRMCDYFTFCNWSYLKVYLLSRMKWQYHFQAFSLHFVSCNPLNKVQTVSSMRLLFMCEVVALYCHIFNWCGLILTNLDMQLQVINMLNFCLQSTDYFTRNVLSWKVICFLLKDVYIILRLGMHWGPYCIRE